jgi:hypothetical protein
LGTFRHLADFDITQCSQSSVRWIANGLSSHFYDESRGNPDNPRKDLSRLLSVAQVLLNKDHRKQ